MENEFLLNINYLSLEVIIIAIIVFSLTMIIKYPIKKATAKLEENRRKAVNTFIVFIPMGLSFVLCLLYFGIFMDKWLDSFVIDTIGRCYLLSVCIYAVFSRILIIIKGAKNTDEGIEILLPKKETINTIKKNIENLSILLKVDKEKVQNIINEMEKLIETRKKLTCGVFLQNTVAIKEIDKKINELTNEKLTLDNSINKAQEELDAYQKTIN